MYCQKCGNPVHPSASFCENCGAEVTKEATQPQVQSTVAQAPAYEQPAVQQAAPVQAPVKRENVLTGIVGALLGACIGGAAIILLSQMGYVAAISGLILAACTLKGYELLGGKLSVKGTIICVVIMLVAPYIADTIDWALVIMRDFAEYELTFGEAYQLVGVLLEDGAIDEALYWENLLMIYGFTALGAIGTVIGAFKDNKKK